MSRVGKPVSMDSRVKHRVAMLAYTHYSSDPRVRREAEALVKAGHAVTVFCLDDGPASTTIDGVAVRVGRGEAGAMSATKAQHEAMGRTVVTVHRDDRCAGLIVLADTVKASSAAGLASLRSLGLRPILLTGDNRPAALAVAAQVGIDDVDVIADVLPADKVAAVARLQSEGSVVAMVGDGVNDAAALAQADLGIAMGTGTDVAIEASDLTLMRPDLGAAADAIRLSRRTLAVIKGNLFWAFAYNVAAIPLAMSWLLSPIVASAAMRPRPSIIPVSGAAMIRIARNNATGKRPSVLATRSAASTSSATAKAT